MPARRIFFAGADTFESVRHRALPSAVETDDGVHRSMNFDHAFRRIAGSLMESVNILCDQRVEFPRRSSSTSAVPCIGLCLPRGGVQPRLPRRFPHLAIRNVVTNVGHLFGCRVLSPHALRSTKVRNAGVGRDARACQDNHAFGGIYPAMNGLDVDASTRRSYSTFCLQHAAVRFRLTGHQRGLYSESLRCQGMVPWQIGKAGKA